MTGSKKLAVHRGVYSGSLGPQPVANYAVSDGKSCAEHINILRHCITALLRYETLQMLCDLAVQVQVYVERLILEALRNGRGHGPTKKFLHFWIIQNDLVHKIFATFVTRYERFPQPYTRLHFASPRPPGPACGSVVVLELKGGPHSLLFAPMPALDMGSSSVSLLLSEAKRQYYARKRRAQLERLPPANIGKLGLRSSDRLTSLRLTQ